MNAEQIIKIKERLSIEQSTDDYKLWRISDIAKLRLDAKWLIKEIESLQAELAEYKNTGLTSKDIQKIATAKSEGRLIIRPFTWEEIRKQRG